MRAVVLVALLAFASVSATVETFTVDDSDGDTVLERDKRQLVLGFEQDINNRFVLILNDGGTKVMEFIVVTDSQRVDLLIANETLRFEPTPAILTFPDQPLVFEDITTLHVAPEDLSPIQTIATGGLTTLNGPGTVFINSPEALYSQRMDLTDAIEGIRQIVVMPPVTLGTDVRSDGFRTVVVLQVNGGDVVTLSGSQSITVSSQETVTYGSNTVTVRRGGTIVSRTEGIDTLGAITSGPVFNTYTESGPPLSGPGQLIIDESNRRAFFTNDGQTLSTLSTLRTGVISSTFVINGTMLSNRGGMLIMDLGTRQSQSFPTARSVDFDSATDTLTFRDAGNRIVGQSFGIRRFSLFDNDELQTFTTSVSRTLSSGGTLYTDGGGNALFSTNGGVDALINANVPLPPEPLPEFTFMTNSQGIATLAGNGRSLVTLSGAQIIEVPRFGSVAFQNNVLSLRDSTGDPITMFEGTNQFSVSTEDQLLGIFNVSAPQIYAGPGRLYINNGQAFYSSRVGLTNGITTFLDSLPPPRIGFEFDLDPKEPTGNVDVTVGGVSVVTVTGANVTTVQPQQLLIYHDNTVTPLDGMTVGSGTLMYDMELLSFVSDDPRFPDPVVLGNFTVLYHYDGMIFDFSPFPENRTTFPGNGRLFFNTMGPDTAALYTTSDIVADDAYAVILAGLFATDQVATNVGQLGVFDGSRYLTFTGSAPMLLTGPGVLYTNGERGFYSTDGRTNQRIVTTVSETIPTITRFRNGTLVVTNNGRDIYSFMPGRQTSIITFGANDDLRLMDGMLVSNRFPDEPGINSLTIFNGFTFETLTSSDLIMGPGTLVIDRDAGTAFFTTSRQAGTNIANIAAQIEGTFRRPIIDQPLIGRVASKYPTVDATFGQQVRAYEGADVRLLCNVIAGNPTPEVEFFRQVGDDFVPINASSDKFDVVGNTLVIRNIDMADSKEYICIASNAAGRAQRTTALSVGRALAPVLVETYLPFIPRANQTVARAQRPDRGASIDINLHNTKELFISCKGSGRPKPVIEWAVDGRVIDFSAENNTYSVTVPRPGSSYLTVPPPLDTICQVYSCAMENAATPLAVRGEVEVCGEQYQCTPGNFSECSSSCGTGYQMLEFVDCTKERDGMFEAVNFTDIPAGIIVPQIKVCVARVSETNRSELFCPVETFSFFPTGEFSECSKTCDCGIKTRNVTCRRYLNGVFDSVMNDSVCITSGTSLRVPRRWKKCNNFPCPEWRAGVFGGCTVTCGGGTRNRSVECVSQRRGNRGTVLSDAACNSTRPVDTVSCNEQPCLHFEWRATRWGGCSDLFCDERNVTCLDTRTSTVVDDDFCSFQRNRPNRVRSCGGRICNFGFWSPEDYGECSETCGKGTRMREVLCRSQQGGEVIHMDYCNLRPHKPSDSEACYNAPCPGEECVREPVICSLLALINRCGNDPLTGACCISCPDVEPTPTPTPVPTPSAEPSPSPSPFIG